ncbi:MAG: alpha/beta hydrolase [Desulfosarcinaceae bacterium]|nr:alpha/beta hydrolase [Desulfosarcinaceae bacterium]
MKKLSSLAFLMLVVGLIGCARNDHPLRAYEKMLGTADKLNWTFHRVVEDKEGIGYRFPGYLIGIEKSKRERIGMDRSIDSRLKIDNFNGKVRKRLVARLDDRKQTFVSHIVRYDLAHQSVPRIKSEFLYNIYDIVPHDTSAASSAYDLSWQTMEALSEEIRDRLAEEKFTHVFIFAMGWNTDQQEAVRNYNSLYGNLLQVAQENATPGAFKPLFFGFSWPSRWRWPGISYFNKANDADEIGSVWVNILLNKVLLPIKTTHEMRVVVVGHSFGARAVTRAVFSKALLFDRAAIPATVPDLVIGLQGAFSINRFIAGEGNEGSPYKDHETAAKRFVFTWSDSDTANPIANFVTGADHIGGRYGYKAVQEPPGSDIFRLIRLSESGEVADATDLTETDGRILLVDASKVIRYGTYEKGGMSHSDIYKPEIARFIWQHIERYAP